MPTHDEIRRNVSQAYARAVTAPAPAGCCGTAPKGVAVKLAGYSRDDLSDVPADAVVNSFGCGNPLAFSEVRAGDVVVDLGCGAGIDLLLAARRVGPAGRVIGVDMTDEMLDRARAAIREAELTNVEVRKGLIERMPIESASADWVISNCVINLSPSKDAVFAEIARVLKPGGRMLVADIVAEDLPAEVLASLAAHVACVAGALSEEEYRRGLERAGMTDVVVRERIVYETGPLAALIRSELQPARGGGECGGAGGRAGLPVDEWADRLNGRVWSAVIAARKPER